MTTKAHLMKLITRLSEHHLTKSKHYADEGDQEQADDHADVAEHCVACCKAMMESAKVEGHGEIEKIVPTRVSGVTPTPPGVTAVPRAGQKSLPTPQENPMVAELFGNTQELE